MNFHTKYTSRSTLLEFSVYPVWVIIGQFFTELFDERKIYKKSLNSRIQHFPTFFSASYYIFHAEAIETNFP